MAFEQRPLDSVVLDAGDLVVASHACGPLADDILDTGGTITSAAELLRERGAADATTAATHGVLSGSAVERLAAAPVREVVVTNTLPIDDEKRWDALTVLSIAPIIAEALKALLRDLSMTGDSVAAFAACEIDNALVEVSGLVDPRMKVEIEAVAYVGA